MATFKAIALAAPFAIMLSGCTPQNAEEANNSDNDTRCGLALIAAALGGAHNSSAGLNAAGSALEGCQ